MRSTHTLKSDTNEICILPLPEVMRRTGLSRPTIYRHIGKGLFPRQVRRGAANVGWRSDEIDAYVSACLQLAA